MIIELNKKLHDYKKKIIKIKYKVTWQKIHFMMCYEYILYKAIIDVENN